ncbi:MAG: hydrogenase maturation protease [Thermodesulfovibrio sp.]|nr:hydrogenase maturation protease [Thermodesulfovibrio sp.]MDW7999179.1 hydrogenase maturation protease [Thermodesulfovibrio sp.]
MAKKTVIVGLGNPIVTDDGIGIHLVRYLKEVLADKNIRDVEIKEVYAGGLRLLDELVGYHHAVIIDAMQTGQVVPGSVMRFNLSELISTKNLICMHDTNFKTALELGVMLGLILPEKILIYGIEAKDLTTFSDRISKELEEKIPQITEFIIKDITNELFEGGNV